MATAFIELKNLCKSYATSAGIQEILRDVNLSFVEGEFIALMGPSGSGKSTLMNILGCLDSPTSGSYFLEGCDISLLDGDQQASLRGRVIGFVFQGFNLLPRTTLENNVKLPLLYTRANKADGARRAQALLERVGLGGRYSALPNEISGGEQQRVAIARALINNPKLLLADEPTGNLDSVNSNMIMELFKELNKDGITIFLVTHDPDVASCAKRQIRLLDGRIVGDINS